VTRGELRALGTVAAMLIPVGDYGFTLTTGMWAGVDASVVDGMLEQHPGIKVAVTAELKDGQYQWQEVSQ
jgi:predicted Rossmann fold nucleotide-binding protein DprA/Smf involved in DNA uptake